MPFTHFALFLTFIEHQFKKALKQKFVLFILDYDHALHLQFTWEKKEKQWHNNWNGKNMNTLHKIGR